MVKAVIIIVCAICILMPAMLRADMKEAAMTDNLTYFGHDTFKVVSDGVTIYTDPFALTTKDRADVILITHGHRDHCSPEDVARILTDTTVIVTVTDCVEKLAGMGTIRVVKPGEKIAIEGVSIEAVPAYNTNKKFHPRENAWVGFILTAKGRRIYLAGDTDRIPEMKAIKCDIALLPVSGTYVMTADEAVQAALDIKPKLAIPMHYGKGVVGELSDAERFRDALKGKVEVEILPISK